MSKYKTLFIQLSKVGFLSILVILVLAGAVFYSIQNKKIEKVYAGTGENIIGFAWSENIGWISFNSSNCDTDNDGFSNGGTGCPISGTVMKSYGINITEDAVNNIGKLSGYAWSENIGWISFNRADAMPSGTTPPSNDVGAGYNILAYTDSANKLQGWARALTACDDNGDGDCADRLDLNGDGDYVDIGEYDESDAGTNSGGWDGWMRFNNNSTYGVTLVNGIFSGYAWGSDVLGWIKFSGPTYQVATTFELNIAPNAPSDLSVTEQYCNGRLVFSWTFSDPNINSDMNQQSKYKIDISYTGFGGYSTEEVSSSSTSAIINLSNLGSWYGQTLNYTITVWDNAPSPKSTSASFSYGPLSDREYPLVDFSYNPTKIFAKQDVNFLDGSICYSSGNTPAASCSVWLWDIPGATYNSPSTSNSQNPIAQFPSTANINASLIATDGDTPANSCTVTKSIDVNLPLPKIKEKK